MTLFHNRFYLLVLLILALFRASFAIPNKSHSQEVFEALASSNNNILSSTTANSIIQTDTSSPQIKNILEMDIHSSINPGTGQYLIKGIEYANENHIGLIIITLDTPGGLLSTTRDIVKTMLNSKVPIVVYVGPAGSRAGSAGVFITLASHVAVMAEGTNIGAAHPVSAGGEKENKNDHDSDNKAQKNPMEEKILNDTLALMDSIAEMRKRNQAWAKATVKNSVSVTATEAFKEKAIDMVVRDKNELYQKLDGFTFYNAHSNIKTSLHIKNAKKQNFAMSLSQKVTNFFSDPNIAYLLFLAGLLGIMMELYHPGAIFPGVFGAICLLLGFVSFQILPINYGGVALILLGAVLLAFEFFIPSFGILGIGGIIASALGTLLMFDDNHPDFGFDTPVGVEFMTVAPILIVLIGFVVYVGYLIRKGNNSTTSKLGVQMMFAKQGTVTQTITDNTIGRVFICGEDWKARANETIEVGEKVIVEKVDDLVLLVKPVSTL